MEERHRQAELQLEKAISDLALSLTELKKENYFTAWSNAQRALESLRHLLQVDRDLRNSDVDKYLQQSLDILK